MTPEEARRLLDGTTPGDEWHYRSRWGRVWRVSPIGLDRTFGTLEVSEEDAALIAAAPTLAAMIAGMREEWGYEYESLLGGRVTQWGFRTKVAARWDMKIALKRHWDDHQPTRVVRRYVTEPEVTE